MPVSRPTTCTMGTNNTAVPVPDLPVSHYEVGVDGRSAVSVYVDPGRVEMSVSGTPDWGAGVMRYRVEQRYGMSVVNHRDVVIARQDIIDSLNPEALVHSRIARARRAMADTIDTVHLNNAFNGLPAGGDGVALTSMAHPTAVTYPVEGEMRWSRSGSDVEYYRDGVWMPARDLEDPRTSAFVATDGHEPEDL